MRECSEEMLGIPEHDGNSGAPIDSDAEEPFRVVVVVGLRHPVGAHHLQPTASGPRALHRD
jgi:hypothetical protein